MTVPELKKFSLWTDSFYPFWGIARSEVSRCFRIWIQAFTIPIVFRFLNCFCLVSVSSIAQKSFSSADYLNFLLPGMFVHILFIESFGNVLASFFSSKFSGEIESILSSPISHFSILSGYTFGGVFRSLSVLIGFLIGVRYFFYSIKIFHPFYFCIMAISITILGSLLGFLMALLSKTFDQISFYNFIIQIAFYLSGAFVDIEKILQGNFFLYLIYFNPIFWLVKSMQSIWNQNLTVTSNILSLEISTLLILWLIIALLNFWIHKLLKRGKGNQFLM